MNDRFKFRYVFEKDFGGKTGICYKMPVFNLDDAVRSVFENKIIEYINFDYKLIAKNQCTGLKDKNGKLIYEGDIVKSDFEFVTKTVNPFLFKVGDVVFQNLFGGFAINSCRNATPFQQAQLGSVEAENCEVIGNIYENS